MKPALWFLANVCYQKVAARQCLLGVDICRIAVAAKSDRFHKAEILRSGLIPATSGKTVYMNQPGDYRCRNFARSAEIYRFAADIFALSNHPILL